MLTFTPHDFVPLEESGRAWRWSDPRTNQLPSGALAHIKALRPERAVELAPRAEHLCSARRDGMAAFTTTVPADEVRRTLAGLHIEDHERAL